MPLSFDTAMTTFWWGVACLNLSFLRRSWSLQGLLGVFILWAAVFPMFESAVRDILRAAFRRHPEQLGVFSVVAALPYLLAVVVLAFRWSRRSRPSPGA